jgi:hypothetical protein
VNLLAAVELSQQAVDQFLVRHNMLFFSNYESIEEIERELQNRD